MLSCVNLDSSINYDFAQKFLTKCYEEIQFLTEVYRNESHSSDLNIEVDFLNPSSSLSTKIRKIIEKHYYLIPEKKIEFFVENN